MGQRTAFVGGVIAGGLASGLIAWAAWPSPAIGDGGSTAAGAGKTRVGEPLRQPLALPRDAGPAGPSDAASPPGPRTAVVASPAAGPSTPARSDAVASTGVAPDPAIPAVTLSAEHAAVLVGRRRPPTLQEQHADFVNQPKDPVHSQALEASLRQAIDAGNASGEFELMTVDCRTTLCEVLAFGNLPSSGERWNRLTAEMAKAPWYAEHVRGESTSAAVQNNRYVIVTILQRKR